MQLSLNVCSEATRPERQHLLAAIPTSMSQVERKCNIHVVCCTCLHPPGHANMFICLITTNVQACPFFWGHTEHISFWYAISFESNSCADPQLVVNDVELSVAFFSWRLLHHFSLLSGDGLVLGQKANFYPSVTLTRNLHTRQGKCPAYRLLC